MKFLALILSILTLQCAEAKVVGGYSLSKTTILLDKSAKGKYVYNDILSAIEALNAMPVDDAKTLLIAPGVYWLDDPDDAAIRSASGADWGVPFAATLTASHVRIIGLDGNPQNAVIAANRGQTQGAIGNYTMLHVKGSDVSAENVTFGNYCNVDLVFPLDTLQNRPRRADAIVQAQIAICDRNTDRFYFKNCRFISRLNLCPFVGARRTYYENCHFECTDDALNGMAVYLGCHFTFFSSKPFYSTDANGGAVLLNCDIDSHVDGVQYFTKAGGPLSLVDVRIHGPKVSSVAWSRGNEPFVGYTYNVTLNGAPVNIDTNPARTVDMHKYEELIVRYKTSTDSYNVAGLLAGDDGWNPTNATDVHSYATTLLVTPNKRIAEAQGDIVDIEISAMRWGGYEAYPSYTQQRITKNRESHEAMASGTIEDYGLRGIYQYMVKGYFVQAPNFRVEPHIARAKPDCVECRYEIENADKVAECSTVSWYRILPDGRSVCVRRSNVDGGCDIYFPTPADANCDFYATVEPRLQNSYAGEAMLSNTLKLNNIYNEKTHISTDFSDVPLELPVDDGAADVWLLDAYKPADTKEYSWQPNTNYVPWSYDFGCDEEAKGLVTQQRGARLRYWYSAKTEELNMRLDLFVCKPAGQGFGSATGQYLDIALWHDRKSQSGYSLRIERTPDYDRAVVMSIMHHQGDRVAPISKPVVTRKFRNSCRISISIKDSHFVASIQNLTEASDAADSVETTIVPMAIYGLSLQHTGSVGANGLKLNSLKITRD